MHGLQMTKWLYWSIEHRVPGSPRSHVGRYSWYERCPPTVWPPSTDLRTVAAERDCLTNAMLFVEIAEAFGWACFQRSFDYYAQNLTRKTKVGNNDQKADNYWYWFLSVSTQRDLTHFFNDNNSWAYGVTDNFRKCLTTCLISLCRLCRSSPAFLSLTFVSKFRRIEFCAYARSGTVVWKR